MAYEDSFHVLYQQKLKDLAKSHANYLASGSSESYEEYKHACGIIAGLNEALAEYQTLLRKFSLDEGEDLDE